MKQLFYSINQLSEIYGLSRSSVIRRRDEMKGLIGKVYSRNDFTNSPPRIRLDAFQDYLDRKELIEELLRNDMKVEPFRARTA